MALVQLCLMQVNDYISLIITSKNMPCINRMAGIVLLTQKLLNVNVLGNHYRQDKI